jgi:hypothetical protein
MTVAVSCAPTSAMLRVAIKTKIDMKLRVFELDLFNLDSPLKSCLLYTCACFSKLVTVWVQQQTIKIHLRKVQTNNNN